MSRFAAAGLPAVMAALLGTFAAQPAQAVAIQFTPDTAAGFVGDVFSIDVFVSGLSAAMAGSNRPYQISLFCPGYPLLFQARTSR